jgi:hypothetical protein
VLASGSCPWHLALGTEREVLGEERDDFGFDAIGDVVDVVAVVDCELMGDAVALAITSVLMSPLPTASSDSSS